MDVCERQVVCESVVMGERLNSGKTNNRHFNPLTLRVMKQPKTCSEKKNRLYTTRLSVVDDEKHPLF